MGQGDIVIINSGGALLAVWPNRASDCFVLEPENLTTFNGAQHTTRKFALGVAFLPNKAG